MLLPQYRKTMYYIIIVVSFYIVATLPGNIKQILSNRTITSITVTALIFTVLIFHESTTWKVFTIIFSQIRIEERPFQGRNSYYSEYSQLYFHEIRENNVP